MTRQQKKTKVAVIGGGPGGYAAAFKAADLGLDVTLIDREANPGGVCLYRGCIPSKALLHVAKLLRETQESAAWGITFKPPEIDLDRLRGWKEGVVDRLTGGLGQLCRARGLQYIHGSAAFRDSKTLSATTEDGKVSDLTVDYTIVATGSNPTTIPGIDVDNKRILDSTGALTIDDVPKRLLVIGGGYIGLELGTVYAALGSDVTVVEMTPGLLPGADRDLVKVLESHIENHFGAILLNTRVDSVKPNKSGIEVSLTDSTGTRTATYDKILVAVGRRPNTKDVGLEHTSVTLDDRGFITVDNQARTSDPAVFAIGDVAGEPMLAHKASHEGIVAAEVIAGHKSAFTPNAIPAVVFTDPEMAWCGLSESDAERENRKVRVTRFPWAASGRALTLGRTDGLTKLILDPDTERILGCGICGPGAGELIAEAVLAVEMAAVASDLALTIHPHPTLSETMMESAEMFAGASTHIFRPGK